MMKLARLLNAFNILEISSIIVLLYYLGKYVQVYVDYIEHIKIVNQAILEGAEPGAFMLLDSGSYFGAIIAIITAIIGLVKYIYHTGVDIKE